MADAKRIVDMCMTRPCFVSVMVVRAGAACRVPPSLELLLYLRDGAQPCFPNESRSMEREAAARPAQALTHTIHSPNVQRAITAQSHKGGLPLGHHRASRKFGISAPHREL